MLPEVSELWIYVLNLTPFATFLFYIYLDVWIEVHKAPIRIRIRIHNTGTEWWAFGSKQRDAPPTRLS